jgi:hypothetical protein
MTALSGSGGCPISSCQVAGGKRRIGKAAVSSSSTARWAIARPASEGEAERTVPVR